MSSTTLHTPSATPFFLLPHQNIGHIKAPLPQNRELVELFPNLLPLYIAPQEETIRKRNLKRHQKSFQLKSIPGCAEEIVSAITKLAGYGMYYVRTN
jgi:hypothetical protein